MFIIIYAIKKYIYIGEEGHLFWIYIDICMSVLYCQMEHLCMCRAEAETVCGWAQRAAERTEHSYMQVHQRPPGGDGALPEQ